MWNIKREKIEWISFRKKIAENSCAVRGLFVTTIDQKVIVVKPKKQKEKNKKMIVAAIMEM